MRRTTNETASEDLRHLRSRRAGGGLQGRADVDPVPDRAGQDPAQPAFGNLRPASAAAQHRNQAGTRARPAALHQGLRRLTATVAGTVGRSRSSWAGAAVLFGYLVLFPPILVLGPLAALLAASRPDSPREWIWLGVTVGAITLFAAGASGIASTMLIGWGLMAAGAFALLMLTRNRQLITGALGACGLATAGATAWAWTLGTRWKDITLAVAHDGWERCRELLNSGLFSPERAEGVRV